MLVRAAHKTDLPQIQALLSQAELPHQDIETHVQCFQVVIADSMLIAAGGLEIYADIGLLRSLVVAPEHRSGGIGRIIYGALLEQARRHKLKSLYLLTETAQAYFQRLGFDETARASAPTPIQNTAQFSNLCPDSARLMVLRLEERG